MTVARSTLVPGSTMVAFTSMSPATDWRNQGTLPTVASGGDTVASTATLRTTGPASSIFRPEGGVTCVWLLEASVAVVLEGRRPTGTGGGRGGCAAADVVGCAAAGG